jgi:hypothetical protein
LKERLLHTLLESGGKFTADAVEHSELVENGSAVEFIAPREFHLALRDTVVEKALSTLLGKPARIKVSLGEGAAAPSAPVREQTSADAEEATRRALAHPGVQQFQQTFPGARISGVRDLKE